MKIRLYTILLSFILPLVCYAQQPEDSLPEPIQLARMNVITVGGGVTAAGGGPDAWYESHDGTTSTDMAQDLAWYGGRVTILASGTATKLRVYAEGEGAARTVKLAVYTYTSGTNYALWAYCSTAVNATVSDDNGANLPALDCDIDRDSDDSVISGKAVTLDDLYYVFPVANGWTYLYKGTAYHGASAVATYATYPASNDTLDTSAPTSNTNCTRVGMYVD